jgi:hypothetical protein
MLEDKLFLRFCGNQNTVIYLAIANYLLLQQSKVRLMFQ